VGRLQKSVGEGREFDSSRRHHKHLRSQAVGANGKPALSRFFLVVSFCRTKAGSSLRLVACRQARVWWQRPICRRAPPPRN